MNLKDFFNECHEKGVIKMLSIYVISSWIILQVLSVIQNPLDLPEKIITYVIVALLILFPVYIFYIWKIRLASMEKTDNGSGQIARRSKFHKLYFTHLAVTTILCFSIAFFIGLKNFNRPLEIPVMNTGDKIAVLEFGNNTGDSENDILGKMAADWIIHGITENQIAEVISPEIVSSYASLVGITNAAGDENFIKKYFKPSKIISGNFYQEGDQLFLNCRLLEGSTDDVIIAFQRQTCNLEEPLDCIESLKQVILSYLATQDTQVYNLQDDPPNFIAYQYLLNAKATNGDDEKYLELLNKAIAADSNYFEPKVLRIAQYYNLEKYKTADSLLQTIDPTYYNDKRQLNLLSLYENLLKGNNAKIFDCMYKEYKIAPDELASNSSTMVVALQFINRPELVETIYNSLKVDLSEIDNCFECRSRLYIKGLADNELGRYDKVIELMHPIAENSDDLYLQKPLISAYIRSGNDAELETYLSKKSLRLEQEDLFSLYLYMAKEFLLQENTAEANKYLEKIYNNKSLEDEYLKAEAYYFSDDFPKALPIFKRLLEKDPDDIRVNGRLAALSSKMGNFKDSRQYLKKLESLKGDYQYGSVDYQIGVVYAVEGNWEKAKTNLMRSVAMGNTYNSENFQNDPHFLKYFQNPDFKKILNYWK